MQGSINMQLGRHREKNRGKTNVLFVEDNDMDFELAKRAFRLAKLNTRIIRHKTGQSVLDMLTKNTAEGLDPKEHPHLIFLDLGMPEISGQEILTAIRQNEHMKEIPVIILSGHTDQETINELYEMGANSFMIKPMNFDDLTAFFQLIRQYWFDVMKLPLH